MFAKCSIWTFFSLCVVVLFPRTTCECNEFVCGSVVSKCLLTQSCECKLTDCFCCKDCLKCLGRYYTECCSCLEMCPNRNETLRALAPKSQIGDFEGLPELFDTLTAEEDDNDQWTATRFPMLQSLNENQHNFTESFGFDDQADELAINCTVIYLNSCTTNKKCGNYCESMGSRSYRWFHDGCCECVGANCFNYGINDSRCSSCPEEEEQAVDIRNKNNDDEPDFIGVEEDDIVWEYDEEQISFE